MNPFPHRKLNLSGGAWNFSQRNRVVGIWSFFVHKQQRKELHFLLVIQVQERHITTDIWVLLHNDKMNHVFRYLLWASMIVNGEVYHILVCKHCRNAQQLQYNLQHSVFIKIDNPGASLLFLES